MNSLCLKLGLNATIYLYRQDLKNYIGIHYNIRNYIYLKASNKN